MNSDSAESNWKQVKGEVKLHLAKLTDDEIHQIASQRDQLIGRIQNCYGLSKADANRQLRHWESRQTD